jgi:hypothetical protein
MTSVVFSILRLRWTRTGVGPAQMKMRTKILAVRRFIIIIIMLDLSSYLIGFIDDEEPSANDSNSRLYAPSTMPDEEEEAFEAFLARIDKRVQSQSESSRLRRLRTNTDDLEVHTDTLARLPSTDDYPLWRVRCRVTILFVSSEESYLYLS